MTRTMLAVLLLSAPALADDGPDEATIRAAVARAAPLIVRGAEGSAGLRDCFTCHNQAMPVVALSLVRRRGVEVDPAVIQAQAEHTEADLTSALEDYKKGQGQPGGVTRAGYAMWTLEAGGWAPDETTAAVAGFLLTRDADRGRWRESSNRPPSEASPFTATYLALRALQAFAPADRKDDVATRVTAARRWLESTEPEDTEDRVFRLWALRRAEACDDIVDRAAEDLLATQNEDGSWSQLPQTPGDAYATGSALVALHLAHDLPTTDSAYRKGLAFLLKAQKDDGSWYVKSRSKPFQTYYESGFPHKADQFISIAASSWATAALGLALPETAPAK